MENIIEILEVDFKIGLYEFTFYVECDDGIDEDEWVQGYDIKTMMESLKKEIHMPYSYQDLKDRCEDDAIVRIGDRELITGDTTVQRLLALNGCKFDNSLSEIWHDEYIDQHA